MTDPLLTAYDDQLRHRAEVSGALEVIEHGPLLWARFEDGGFVTYRNLADQDVDRLIADTVAHFRDETDVAEFEWKTRGHDGPPNLDELLRAHGFVADEIETVMAGEIDGLVTDVELPDDIHVRQAGVGGDLADDVRRASTMQNEVFGGGGHGWESALRRLQGSNGLSTFWLAEVDGDVVSAGRLEIVPDSEFAGLWGGATRAPWRGKGIYRAMTAARARYARGRGVRYLQSDCTEMSRPILERSGLRKITTTTPYVWTR
ncbi:GNAT family N-acetyltransferase [Calidifontibacter terrae]